MPSLPTPRYTYVMRSRLTFVLLPLLLAALTVRADYREGFLTISVPKVKAPRRARTHIKVQG